MMRAFFLQKATGEAEHLKQVVHKFGRSIDNSSLALTAERRDENNMALPLHGMARLWGPEGSRVPHCHAK